LVVRPTLASMGQRPDFFGVAHGGPVGTSLLQTPAAGDYCHRAQDRNSSFAHNVPHPKTQKDYSDLNKTQDLHGARKDDRSALKASPCRNNKGRRAPAHTQPAVAIPNHAGAGVLVITQARIQPEGAIVPRRGCIRHEESPYQCCGTTNALCHRCLLAVHCLLSGGVNQ
jgi:hypothetical protein